MGFGEWRRGLRRLLALALLLGAAPGAAQGEDGFPQGEADGFLAQGEYVYENPEAGVWRYLSPVLRIEIIRHQREEGPLVYTVADIRSKAGSAQRFAMIPKDPDNRMHRQDFVDAIARENGVVFATSSDFAHLRIQQKGKTGILLRAGEVLATKTYKTGGKAVPNLDTLALFPDGDMRVYSFNEKTAEDFLSMGAVDVLSFGPILIRGGIINQERLLRYGQYREPRVAIGMVEKGHYISIMVEGRHEESDGMDLGSLAQLFADYGCTLAFNLDGGQSATMAFMGKQIIRVGKKKSPDAPARSTAEILGIGYSRLVQAAAE